jgi:hypothetical protein
MMLHKIIAATVVALALSMAAPAANGTEVSSPAVPVAPAGQVAGDLPPEQTNVAMRAFIDMQTRRQALILEISQKGYRMRLLRERAIERETELKELVRQVEAAEQRLEKRIGEVDAEYGRLTEERSALLAEYAGIEEAFTEARRQAMYERLTPDESTDALPVAPAEEPAGAPGP